MDAPPLLERQVHEGLCQGNAGAVHADVERAPAGSSMGDDGRPFLRRGDVEPCRDGVEPRGPDFLHRALDGGGI
jgi:hypothetical protein